MRERGTFYTLKWQGRRGIKLKSLEYIDNGIFHSLFLTGLDYTLGIFARLIWVSSNLFARPGYAPCKSILLYISLSLLSFCLSSLYTLLSIAKSYPALLSTKYKNSQDTSKGKRVNVVLYITHSCVAQREKIDQSDLINFYFTAKRRINRHGYNNQS